MFRGRIFGDSLRRQEVLRIVSYASLLLCDLTAIRTAFRIAGSVRGEFWLQLNGFPVVWLFMIFYAIAAWSDGAISRPAFRSRLASITLTTKTALMTCAATTMIIFFTQSGLTLSRLALGTAMLLSILFIALTRIVFLTLFLIRGRGIWDSHLLILDGMPGFAGFDGVVIDAGKEGLEPDLHDPAMLAKLGDFTCNFDSVTVACADIARRSNWGLVLKSFDIHGEVVLVEGRPLGSVGIGRFCNLDTLVVTRGTLSLTNRIKKRGMDIIIAAIGLVVLAPVIAIVAIAIKLDSEGPVFFRQPRIGYDNRVFRIIKFRSFRVDTTDEAGSRSTARGDDRITTVGRFIRATSIDELPQLINVLKGEMSLVGPRPHALGSLAGGELFWEVDTAYWCRHSLKPGITGLAQIRGFRGATHNRADLEHRLRADIEYINGWTLWRDVRILLATVRVLAHPNAY